MHKRLKTYGSIAAFLGMIVMSNAHWAIMQTVAWGGMLVTYTARSGLETGIRETFDGAHPCKLCCVIKDAKSSEQSSGKINPYVLTVRLLAIKAPAMVFPGTGVDHWPVYQKELMSIDRCLDPPPVPPPRGSLV